MMAKKPTKKRKAKPDWKKENPKIAKLFDKHLGRNRGKR